MKLNIPIYLDEEVSAFVEKIASKKRDRSILSGERASQGRYKDRRGNGTRLAPSEYGLSRRDT